MRDAPRPVLDARDPAAAATLGTLPEWDLARPLRRPRRARDRPRPRLAARRVRRASPPTTRASSPASTPPGLLGGDPPLGAHPGRLRPDHELRRPAPLPEHHSIPARAKFFGDQQAAITDLTAAAGLLHARAQPRRRRTRSAALLAADAGARALQAGARPHPGDEALPALRRAREVPARPVRGRRQPPGTGCSTRPWPGSSFDGRRRDAAARGDAEPALRPGPRPPPGRRRGAGRGLPARLPLFARITNTLAKEKEIEDRWRKLPTPQMARHLSNDVEPEVVAGAARRRGRRLSAPLAPLLRAEGALARARQARGLGPQRAAAAGGRPQDPLGRGPQAPCSTPTPASTRAWPSSRAPFFDQRLDRRAGQARQGPRRLRPSDRHRGAPLRAAELPRQAARRDDAGARARPRRAPARSPPPQGELLASTPLTLAETASRLRRDADLPAACSTPRPTPPPARSCSPRKVEDMINTVVRQIAFYDFESQAARRPPPGRADPRRHQRALDVGADRVARPRLHLHARLRDLLVLHPALHPLAVLRLRLCLRRRAGERALRRLPRGRPGLRGEVLRHAEGRRLASTTRSCSPPSASTPPTRRSGTRASASSPA